MDYQEKGSFFGYDWLTQEDAQARKKLIATDLQSFLYFTPPTNKGTIRTAEMLADAQTDEDRAAIWVAATAKELREREAGKGVHLSAIALFDAACSYLRGRYPLWHHAMRGLVPQVVVPSRLLTSVSCENAAPVMELILLNTLILKHTYCILQYTSQKDAVPPAAL